MLTRQKILLALLEEAGKPLSATVLVKLAFLLRHDLDLGNHLAFYDFVPYRFGPFSFALYRELAILRRDGYVSPDEDRVSLDEATTPSRRKAVDSLTSTARSAVAEVIRRNRRRSQTAIIADVYERYPWFATRSKLKNLVPKNVPKCRDAELAVYTVGYEGKSVDSFFDGLLRTGIRAILDVRANPVSRKYGFARRSLSEIAAKLNIVYHHLPKLGIASDDRAELSDFDSYQRLLDRYEKKTLPERGLDIQRLVDLLQSRPSALLCMEKDIRCCHRARLATAAAKRSGLEVIHL